MLKKKILFSISYYTPYVSGLTICTQRVADNLAMDNRVEILCLRHDMNLPEHEGNIWRANPLFKIGKGFVSVDWLVKSWNLAKPADVVVVNLPQFEGFVPALIAKMFKKRVISVYHCEITIKNKILQLILDVANLLSVLISDKVVVYTMDYVENSRLFKFIKNKLVEIYPPIL